MLSCNRVRPEQIAHSRLGVSILRGKKVKRLFEIVFIILLILTHFNLKAQENIARANLLVLDSSTNKPIAALLVYVYNEKSGQIVLTVETDQTGHCIFDIDTSGGLSFYFSIVPSLYKKYTAPLEFSVRESQPQLIMLIPQRSTTLKNVTVVGSYRLVEMKNNRLSYDVRNVPNYENMTTLDVINYLPFLSTDERKVKLMGQELVILINNKPHAFYSNASNLNALPPQAIEKIEVNYLPSARNEQTKVMNITLKKSYFLGWTGNASLNASPYSINPVARLGYWSNRSGFDLSVNYSFTKSIQDGDNVFATDKGKISVAQIPHSNNRNSSGAIFGSAFYNIDSSTTIDFQWTYNAGKSRLRRDISIDYSDSVVNHQKQIDLFREFTESEGHTVGLNYTKKYKKQGKEFYILSQFSTGGRSADSYAELSTETTSGYDLFSNKSVIEHARTKELTAEAILVNSLGKKLTYTIGGKFIKRWNGDAVNISNIYFKPPPDNLLDNIHFSYNQTIIMAYADLDYRITKKVSMHGGLNTQLANTIYKWPYGISQRYVNLIPNISLSYTINDYNTVSVSYIRSLLRPDLSSLLNFNRNQSTYYQDSGNVNLQPQHSNRFEFQYFGSHRRFRYGMTAGYSFINDFIDEFYIPSSQGTLIKTLFNSVTRTWTFGFNVDFPLTRKIRFSHFSSGSIITQKGYGYDNKLLSGYLEDKIYYNLNKTQRLFLSMNAFSPNVTLQGKSQSMAYWNTKIGYGFFFSLLHGNPSQFSLVLSNPWLFNGLTSYTEQTGPGFYYYSKTLAANPYVGIQFAINFKGKRFSNSRFDRSKSIQNNDVRAKD